MESSWCRYHSMENLRRLFRIHDLFVLNRINPDMEKAEGIKEYLDSHEEIEKYIIINDIVYQFEKLFKDVICLGYTFVEENFEQAVKILK